MDAITFTVPAVPVAQPRQRHRIIPGRNFVQNYTPVKHKVNDFKATVRMAAAEAYNGAPLDGPLKLTAGFVFPRPSRLIWKTRAMPRSPHFSKPDRDNCEKSLLDALKGTLFVDDAQVCDGPVVKCYAAGDEQPHVEVTIESLHPGGQ
jgi:Holliday junction resolvase RusA-like endonuclease